MLHLSDLQRDSLYSIFLIEASLGDSVRTNQSKSPHKIQQFKNAAKQNHLKIDTLLNTEQRRESRKEWILWMLERAGKKSSNVKGRQFWQHHNKPIELWSADVIDQKADYIHNNSVEAGFVQEAHYWQYSSAIDYSGGQGLVKIESL